MAGCARQDKEGSPANDHVGHLGMSRILLETRYIHVVIMIFNMSTV